MFAGDLLATIIDVAEGDVVLAAAVEDYLALVASQILPRGLEGEAVVLGHRLQLVEVVDAAPVPAFDHAFRQGQLRVADQLFRVEELLHPQAVAGGAGAGRVVEREHPRFEFGDGVAADRTGEARRERDIVLFTVHEVDHGGAVGQTQGGLEGFCQALLEAFAHLDAVHHHADVVLAVLVQRAYVVEFQHLAVDHGAHKALGAQLRQQLQVLALASADHRGQQHQLAAFRQRHHLVDHLRDGLGLEVFAVFRAARGAGTGEQQAQVVVDLGDGADGGARVVGGGLLLDGDRRRQPLDMVHVGLFHHRQELARIGGQ